jgi:hypothetical protein
VYNRQISSALLDIELAHLAEGKYDSGDDPKKMKGMVNLYPSRGELKYPCAGQVIMQMIT